MSTEHDVSARAPQHQRRPVDGPTIVSAVVGMLVAVGLIITPLIAGAPVLTAVGSALIGVAFAGLNAWLWMRRTQPTAIGTKAEATLIRNSSIVCVMGLLITGLGLLT